MSVAHGHLQLVNGLRTQLLGIGLLSFQNPLLFSLRMIKRPLDGKCVSRVVVCIWGVIQGLQNCQLVLSVSIKKME